LHRCRPGVVFRTDARHEGLLWPSGSPTSKTVLYTTCKHVQGTVHSIALQFAVPQRLPTSRIWWLSFARNSSKLCLNVF
jgi:hypothetical protein